MISTFGATQAQADKFLELYKAKAPLRAAAEEAGINIIQATMIARHSGILRITEAAIINSRAGEIGRTGENIFQKHFPEAVNTNLSVRQNNPYYDFILNGVRIDVKTSTGVNARGQKKFRIRVGNKFKTDLFVLIVKEDDAADIEDESAYKHCFIIPSLFLLNNKKLEINKGVLRGEKLAWSEYLFPIEQMRENVLMLTQNPEMLAIPPEVRELAELNGKVKEGVRHAKTKRNRTTA